MGAVVVSAIENPATPRRRPGGDSKALVVWPVAPAPRLPELLLALTDDERERAASIVLPDARAQFVCAHTLKRWLLAASLQVTPESLRFGSQPSGKPFLTSPAAALHFSLSHTQTHVAAFVGEGGPVGVDVETERPGEAWRGLVAETFHIHELSRCWPITKPVFYRYWTAKEASAKALGTGLAVPFDTVELYPLGGTERYTTNRGGWQLHCMKVTPLTHVAYCHGADGGPGVWLDYQAGIWVGNDSLLGYEVWCERLPASFPFNPGRL